jgi:hypothetical protein
MVTNLQFVAVATYLIWCLISSLTESTKADESEGDL